MGTDSNAATNAPSRRISIGIESSIRGFGPSRKGSLGNASIGAPRRGALFLARRGIDQSTSGLEKPESLNENKNKHNPFGNATSNSDVIFLGQVALPDTTDDDDHDGDGSLDILDVSGLGPPSLALASSVGQETKLSSVSASSERLRSKPPTSADETKPKRAGRLWIALLSFGLCFSRQKTQKKNNTFSCSSNQELVEHETSEEEEEDNDDGGTNNHRAQDGMKSQDCAPAVGNLHAEDAARPSKDKVILFEAGDDKTEEFVTHIDVEVYDDDVSTLGEPCPVGTSKRQLSIADSVSLNYDFQQANRKDSVAPSVTSYDSTIGATSLGMFQVFERDDDTVGLQYIAENQFVVHAPPGILGIVLASSTDGTPVVRVIQPGSPLASQVKTGDMLLAVDGEDVIVLPSGEVSQLIAEKSHKAVRRFLFIRPSKK